MSAYGTITRASAPAIPPTLLPRTYLLPAKVDDASSPRKALTVFPVTRATVSEELIDYLRGVFNEVVAGESAARAWGNRKMGAAAD